MGPKRVPPSTHAEKLQRNATINQKATCAHVPPGEPSSPGVGQRHGIQQRGCIERSQGRKAGRRWTRLAARRSRCRSLPPLYRGGGAEMVCGGLAAAQGGVAVRRLPATGRCLAWSTPLSRDAAALRGDSGAARGGRGE